MMNATRTAILPPQSRTGNARFSLLAIALAGAPVAGQEPGPASSPAGVIAGSFGVDVVDGRTMAMGPDYKARFEPGSVTFTPALGMHAPENLPLAWTFVCAERGGAALEADPTAEPKIDDLTVAYSRGAAIVERYGVALEGVEQSFVFYALPPGSGDLVVHLALRSELPGELIDTGRGGALFHLPGVGGVSVGVVTGIEMRPPGYRVTLDCSGTLLCCHITGSSLAEMRIEPGQPLWAVFKASSCFMVKDEVKPETDED